MGESVLEWWRGEGNEWGGRKKKKGYVGDMSKINARWSRKGKVERR